MSSLFFSDGIFSDIDQIQRQMSTLFNGLPSSIRAARPGVFPAINVGSTDSTMEIVAFVPGIDPSKIEVTVENGLLTIAGERPRPHVDEERRAYAQERFNGAFRRVIELPRDSDPENVQAGYAEGCLVVSVGKRETSKPKTITVQ